jgi:hypothetical protein
MYPMSLQTTIPEGAAAGDQFMGSVAQLDSQGQAVGGAAIVGLVR